MRNLIYLTAEDIRKLVKGDEVAVPDTNIVLKMPDDTEMAALRMSPYQIGLELFERQDFDKAHVITEERLRMKDNVLELKKRKIFKADYVQVADVIKEIVG